MKGESVLANFIWRLAERIGAQVITFLVSIVLARMIAPEAYGAIAILMVFITIANVIVNNGFASALIQKKDADDLDFSSVFYFSVFFSIVIYIILFVCSDSIAAWYNMPILKPTLRVLGLRIVWGAVNSIQQSYVSRNLIFKKFFFATLGGTLVSAIVGVVLALRGAGVWALVWQYLTNTFIDTIVLWITVKWRPKKCFSFARLKGLLSYGWKLLASALIGAIYDELRALIIGKVYSSDDLAYYTKGQQFPNLVMSNVNASVNSVFFPVLSKIQNDYKEVADTSKKLVRSLVTVIVPLLFGLASVSAPLIRVLLTERWIQCVPYLKLWCLYYLITVIYSAYLQSYKAIGDSGLALKVELVDDIFGIILLCVFFRKGVMAIAIITIISRGIALIICIMVNGKIFQINPILYFMDFVPQIIIAMIMYFSISILLLFKMNDFISIILSVIFGGGEYILLAYLFKIKGFMEIIVFLKERRVHE